MNVHAISVTDTEASDHEGMEAVLPRKVSVDRIIADGANYSIERPQAGSRCGALSVIPLPANAVVHGQNTTGRHDQIGSTSISCAPGSCSTPTALTLSLQRIFSAISFPTSGPHALALSG